MIEIKNYYFHYNKKDGKYYLDKSYPSKKNKGINKLTSKTINQQFAPQADVNEPSTSSAFRAVSNILQPLPSNFIKVLFPVEQFDLASEYNTATSTFTAKTGGVYSLSAAIEFSPDDPNVDYEVRIGFFINGFNPSVDIDYTGFNAAFFNNVEINDIVQLNPGDRVEVFASSTTPGFINPQGLNRFAVAKFPFTTL
ncbi:ABC transporter permease (plasmid) [Priestia aryabhattai]|uniref:ABC transporter permease n=1 Tax=Priestia aryabhattai TaxID=412384 RepID=UPI0025A369C3|nr:ABC transporter permease [Priestia aryabhattai]WJN47721.1 ABC transporter permease [Priestia aryabhattai]